MLLVISIITFLTISFPVSMSLQNGADATGLAMAVTVEVKTGKRRLIEFVLSPMLRYKQESLSER